MPVFLLYTYYIMKSFKQYLKESDPGGELDPFPDPLSGSSSSFNLMSSGSGYIAGIRANDQPYVMYRSMYSPYQSALDPGKQSDDGLVQGGGGFKIQKDSKNFLTNLAKAYGVEIASPEEMQKKMQQNPQAQPQKDKTDHLINQVKMHPAMYLLNQDQNLQKEFDKAFQSMQDWKLTTSNPDQGKNWYELWQQKQEKDADQNKVNLGRMATFAAFRERTTDIHNRLAHMGLHSDSLPHIKNYLDPTNHALPGQSSIPYEQEDSNETDDMMGDNYNYQGQTE